MHRSRSQPWSFRIAAVALGWLAAELVVHLLSPHLTGDSTLERRLARRALAQIPSDVDAPDLDTTNLPFDDEVIHPYLGFVLDPGENRRNADATRSYRITDLGFRRREGNRPDWEGRPYQVAVTGGSVAMLLSLRADRELAGLVADGLGLEADQVGVRSWALGGFKQPQQLMNLAFRLTRGERVDALINLDGFNEVVLPVLENDPARVAASYPRSWNQRFHRVDDPATLEIAARAGAARDARRDLARVFDAPGVRASPTAQLLWWALDRRSERELAELNREAARLAREEGGYQRRGPFQKYDDAEGLQQALVDEWAAASFQMDALCRANGIRYFHFLQPNQYVPGTKNLTRKELREAFDPEGRYAPLVRSGYPRLQAAGERLRERGVRFYDLTRVFAGLEDSVYVDDCCHVSRRGDRLLAEAIVRSILADSDPTDAPR